MPPPPPPPDFMELVDNLAGQGRPFDNPFSPTNQYFAFLSKADLDVTTGLFDVLFEVLPAEWVELVVLLATNRVDAKLPESPASLFHIIGVQPEAILQALGLDNPDNLAEASWYLLTLTPKQNGGDVVNGDLYDPDIDMQQPPLKQYGKYNIDAAQLISLPVFGPGGLTSTGEPPGGLILAKGKAKKVVDGLNSFHPYGKPAPVAAAAPPPPLAIASIGVMNGGQGNCNMLIKKRGPGAGTYDPVTYYDVGYPLFFYIGSLPDNMRYGTDGYRGPILNNPTGDLEVVLSHWDWDHWRLGKIAGLTNLVWVVPRQAIGPVASNFMRSIDNCFIHDPTVNVTETPNYSRYQCRPPAGSATAMLLNNSGLALKVPVRLPVATPVNTVVILTGDANFTSIPVAGMYGPVAGITAVHHGSIAHGAAENPPTPTAPAGQTGRIAYSYGIRKNSAGDLVHCYGFPVLAALDSYRAAGWTDQMSTPEAGHIDVPPVDLSPGNILMADQQKLNAIYNNTAFAEFKHKLE